MNTTRTIRVMVTVLTLGGAATASAQTTTAGAATTTMPLGGKLFVGVNVGGQVRSSTVNNEFSFVQTLRHLVMAMDKWFTAPVLGEGFHPIGLPNKGSLDFPWPGLDYNLTPSVSEALAVRADRAKRFRDYLASIETSDFKRPVEVLENGTCPVQECIYTVFEEEFWHNRYALRDLALLEAAT